MMRAMPRNIKPQIKDAIIDAIRKRVDYAFMLSQQRCPYKTGYLKRHGNYSKIENGAQIIYQCEYASYMERGLKGGQQSVRGFYRRDGVYVRPFSRYMPHREGQHFIESSLEDSFKEFADNFEIDAKQKGIKIIKSI